MLSQPARSKTLPILIALVEDDVVFQRTLVASITSTADMAMCGTATTRAQGLRMLEQTQADVLLVDLGLPDGSGIDVIRVAQQKWPACNAMVCTTFGDETHVFQSLEAGACGYLLKDCSPEQLVTEIRHLHAGGSPISPLIARQVLRRFHQPGSFSRPLARDRDSEKQRVALSEREREVLSHITKGFTSNEIAALMGVSYHTVQTYVRRIYEKLRVKSKSEAIYEAHQRRLIKD